MVTSYQIGGAIVLYFGSSIGAAGGLGAGGLMVPILLVIFRFSFAEATVLSQCTIFGNYISQVFINFRKVHMNDKSRPLIYWDAIICLLPAQLGGSNIGFILQKILPETILLILALLITLFATFKTLIKGLHVYKQETKENSTISDSGSKNDYSDVSNSLLNSNSVSNSSVSIIQDKATLAINYPKLIMGVLVSVWLLYVCLYVTLKAVSLCSPTYFGVLVCIYPLLIVTILWAVSYVSKQQLLNPTSILPGDILFKELSIFPPVLAFIIGIICSLLGIGGGELMGPLLLSLKVLPQVSSATISTMSFFNASASILHYMFANEIDYSWAGIVFCIGVAGGLTGRLSAVYIIEKYNRASVTIFMLVTVLFFSAILLIYDMSTTETDFRFHSFCP